MFKSSINQLFAIVEVQLKSLFRQVGAFIFIAFFPFMFSLLTYSLGSGMLGKSASLEIWFYQLIGFAILTFSLVLTSSSAWYIREGLLTGRLEYLLASPVHPLIIITATSISNGIFGIINFLLVGIVGTIVVYGIAKLLNFFISFLILIITIIPLLGFNLIIAAVTILAKEPETITQPINSIISTTSGFVYPIVFLPYLLQIIGKSLPYYYVVENVRYTIINFVNLNFLTPVPFLFIYLISGFIIYRTFETKFIRKQGTYGW